MSLSFATVNIEREKHIPRVVAFLKRTQPDVACIQELFESDIPVLKEAFGAGHVFFAPMCWYKTVDGKRALEGVGILSRYPLSAEAIHQYAGNQGEITDFIEGTLEEKSATQKYVIAIADVEHPDGLMRIGTTHFPWTPNGEAEPIQRASLVSLLSVTDTLGEFVLCGDFNAPRGKEIFSGLAERLKDNVPLKYESSIDGELHRAGPLPYMVDGVFSTPGYQVHDVEMVSGVSDHCAFTCLIDKV